MSSACECTPTLRYSTARWLRMVLADKCMRREIVAHYRAGAGGLCDAARDGVAILAEQAPKAPPPIPA